MPVQPEPSQSLLQSVLEHAGGDDTLRRFVSLLYADQSFESLDGLDATALASEARASLEMMHHRERAPKIRLRPLTIAAVGQDRMAIEILNDDMPFLVDSVVGELQAQGLAIRLVLHPIFKIRRASSGELRSILGPGDRNWGDGAQESLIVVHVEAMDEARRSQLLSGLEGMLTEVRHAVTDWQSMLARLDRAIADLEQTPPPIAPGLVSETLAFCRWLKSGNFTFLGVRDYSFKGDQDTGELVAVERTSLGLLRDASLAVLSRNGDASAIAAEVRHHLASLEPLIVTKANLVSRVHRRVHMDYVGLKTYDANGAVTGELRMIGLFTSGCYTGSPRDIPFVRRKVDAVVTAAGYPPASHAGKALANVLDTFPRDELFQISADELQTWCAGILDLDLRPRVRAFTRVDRYDRFVSALVYVPRDRITTSNRERIANVLCEAFAGRVSAFTPFFTEGPLVRVHFIIGRSADAHQPVDSVELAARIEQVTRSWDDRLASAITSGGPTVAGLGTKYSGAFSLGYEETFSVDRALQDIQRIERLSPQRPVAIDFYREPGSTGPEIHAAIYRFGPPIPLSERVPVLENLGFSAIDERSYRIAPRYDSEVHPIALADMVLTRADGLPIDLARHDERMEETYLAVFRGEADNDSFNRLVVSAGAQWREAAMLRAYAAYLRQIRSPFGPRYIAETLDRHAGLARDLIELFRARFDPDLKIDVAGRTARQAEIVGRLDGGLAAVPSLDEDRILRHYLNLIRATVRTNFFQLSDRGRHPDTIAFKLDSKMVDQLPDPKPFREIWIYSPRVEGIHLRFAAIARGGIRWSDRAQDFRTEVLGLCKAQQVKNTVIVPTGAKGGFLPKLLPRSGSREEIMKEGIGAYRVFVGAALDITDNIRDGQLVHPDRVVRHEPDDPYLVMAADKGTATFSDYANELSTSRGFWLGDAFASGGSAGYDHKKMAITARGAWECVKRHFREIDIDIQTTPFRVIGVGDMSGDVFGNGMLLSPTIRLVAAFDHRDIFIDPDPDPAVTWAERKRLFDLPRSSWQDYDKSKLSKGGGIFARTAKSIALTPEIARLLNLQGLTTTPAELMRAALKCEADLLWFGGIGTYVRAVTETDEQVGDRANDAIRITGGECRARVVGEGANLGLTQRGRIEFAAAGGRLNTDFIDNSAGVNSSDQEVNIKIALGTAIAGGRLAADRRNALLASMTDDVAAACLVNNIQQSLALSLAEMRGARDMGYLAELMRSLETRGLLDRRLEALPTTTEMRQREAAGQGLTRPELCVLLSWSKIALMADVLASQVPDDSATEPLLIDYFPPALRKDFAGDLKRHQLRREIIAMRVTNSMINRGGPTFAVRLADETGRTISQIAYAYLATRSIYGLPELWNQIDALDGKLSGPLQLELYAATQETLITQTAGLLRGGGSHTLADMIAMHHPVARTLSPILASVMTADQRTRMTTNRTRLVASNVPEAVAARIAALPYLGRTAAIERLQQDSARPLGEIARVLFAAQDHLRLDAIRAGAECVKVGDYFDRLALNGAIGTLENASRNIARDVLCSTVADIVDPAAIVAAEAQKLDRAKAQLDEIVRTGEVTVSRLVVAASQLRDLSGD